MRLAVSGQLLASSRPLAEIVQLLRTLDVDAIELWPGNLDGGETPEERGRYEQKDIKAVRQLMVDTDMSVACLTLGFNILAGCKEHGPAYGTQALKGAVDAAADLGAPIVNCYLAGLEPDTFVEAVGPAAAYAGEAGVTIVLENEAHDDSGQAMSVRSMIERVGSPHFGTQYDPCNYYHAYEEPYPQAYEILRDHIHYVHLKGGCWFDPDNRPEDHRGGTMRGDDQSFIGYTPLLESAFNVEGILHRLSKDGYTGFVTLEPHVTVQAAEEYYRLDVPYVRDHLDRLTASAAPPSS